MLLDSDTFFPSSPHPSEDTLADGLVGWDWSHDAATSATSATGVEDNVEAYASSGSLSLYTVSAHQPQRLTTQNPSTPTALPPQLLSPLQQQRPTNVVLGRATSPNLSDVSPNGLSTALHQSPQSAPPSDYTGLFPYGCKYEDTSSSVPTSNTQYASYNGQTSACSTPSSLNVSSLVGSPSPEQKVYYESSSQPQLPTVENGTADVQGDLLYLPIDGSGLATSSPPAIVTSCDASGKLQQPPQMYTATVNFGDDVGDGSVGPGAWMLKYETDGQMCMTTQTARRGRPKRCKGDVKRGGKGDGDVNADGRRPGAASRALGDVTCYRGVYFDAIRHLWRANWPEESVIIDKGTRNVIDVRRCTRTKGFSAKKFGYQEAQRMAIEHREKMTGPGMVRHYVYQQDATQVPLPPGTRTAKPDMCS